MVIHCLGVNDISTDGRCLRICGWLTSFFYFCLQFMEMVRDCPTLMRHLWNEFFSVGGLMLMFRIRILLCFVAGLMYVFSPLDIIPEGVFGVLGLLDDIFVTFLLAMYISIIYRRLVVSRRMATWYTIFVLWDMIHLWYIIEFCLYALPLHILIQKNSAYANAGHPDRQLPASAPPFG